MRRRSVPEQALWFAGVCDSLLAKVQAWLATYEQGEVARTRPFLELDGRVARPADAIRAQRFPGGRDRCDGAVARGGQTGVLPDG